MIKPMPGQWRRNPTPDPSVLKLVNDGSEAAHNGQVRLMGVVTVDPLLHVEYHCAGDLDDVKRNLLIAGLTRLIQQLSE